MGSNDHLPEVCPACRATYAATQLAADLESLLADNGRYGVHKSNGGCYSVEWFAGLPHGVTEDTLPDAVREAVAEKKRLEAEYEDD
jgi:hypothetical protein